MCYNDIKELEDKIQSLRWDIELYNEIYKDKYGCNITENFD